MCPVFLSIWGRARTCSAVRSTGDLGGFGVRGIWRGIWGELGSGIKRESWGQASKYKIRVPIAECGMRIEGDTVHVG